MILEHWFLFELFPCRLHYLKGFFLTRLWRYCPLNSLTEKQNESGSMPRCDMEERERDDRMELSRARILLTCCRKKREKANLNASSKHWNSNVDHILRKERDNYFPSRNLLNILLISWVSLFPSFLPCGCSPNCPFHSGKH